MTPKQKEQFNRMCRALQRISKGYKSPDRLRREAGQKYGLEFEEALEMAYESILADAAIAVRGVREAK